MEVFFSNLSSDPSLKKQLYHPLELFFAKNYIGSGGRGQDMMNPEKTKVREMYNRKKKKNERKGVIAFKFQRSYSKFFFL